MRLLLAMLAFASFGQTQEKLIVKENAIYTICSFDSIDYFSTFDHEGTFLWEIPFGAKIISVEEAGDRLLLLSRARDGSSYFLSSIERATGTAIWATGIFAPRETQTAIEESSAEKQ